MSDPILPLAVWAEGTLQNDMPANDNALRNEAMSRPSLGVANDAAGGDTEGDVWIVGDTPAGAFATFDEDDIAIFDGAGWHAWAPVEGLRLVVNDVRKVWTGSGGWDDDPSISGGGAVDSVNGQTGAVSLALDDLTDVSAAAPTTTYVLTWNGSAWAPAAPSAGTVTSVGLSFDASLADILSASGSPVTSSGTITASGVDAGSDMLLFWDDSAGKITHLSLGTNLSITGTTLNAAGGGGGGSPGGSDTQVQYNDGGSFGGDSAFTFDDTAKALFCNRIDFAKGTDIARAATTSIGAATGNFVHLTGTTTITSFGTGTAGQIRYIRFAGAGTLTHNATSLILPGGANITTAANDCATAVSEGGSNWRVIFYMKANGQAVVVPAGTIDGWTASTNTASPNNTVNAARLLVASASTNADAVIQPKGTGAFQLQLADGTAAGGDKRGASAIDLQTIRSASTQVASGPRSVVAGWDNTASAQGAVALGGYNTASAQHAVALGNNCDASGTSSIAAGQNAAASASYSVALGGGQADSEGGFTFGRGAHCNGVVASYAEAFGSAPQRTRCTLQGTTTNASPLILTTDGAGASASNQVYMGNANNRSGIYRGLIVARQTGNGGAKKSWEFVAHLDRDNGTLSLVGAVTPTVVASSGPGWSVAVTADNGWKTLQVEVTGASSTTINWSCYIDGQEVAGS